MKCENLSLCIINKDDASNLKRLIRRAKKFVGEIIVVDTGSKDSSVAAAIHAGATKVIKRPDFLDDDGVLKSFALARNESFKHATKDWKMWLDTDDDLSDWESLKEFVKVLERERIAGKKSLGCMYYDYTWSTDRKFCFQTLYGARIIHKDDNFYWKNPIHEILLTDEDEFLKGFQEVCSNNIRVIHLSEGSRGNFEKRNFKILKKWEAVEPQKWSVCYYLGDHYLIIENNPKLAQEYFRKAKEDVKKLENLPKEKQDTRVLRTMYRYFLSIYNSKEYSKCIREIEEYMQSKNGEKVESNFYWILSSCYVKVKTKLSLQKAFDLFFYSIQPGSIAITGENTWGWQFPAQQLKIKTIPCAISQKKYKWVYQSNRPIPKHLMTKFIPE